MTVDYMVIIEGATIIIGAAIAFIQNEKLKSVAEAGQAFAKQSAAYLRITADGQITVAETQEMGELSIKFFEELEEIIGKPVINSTSMPWIKPEETTTPVTTTGGGVQVQPVQVTKIRKMSDETKRWLTFDHDQATQDLLLAQVAAHEEAGDYAYVINYPFGYYEIENGMIKGSGKYTGAKSGVTA